jgi:hypothetical protein
MYKLIGTITLLISFFLFWLARDIFIELFNGRPTVEIQFKDLLFPTILLLIGLFFLFKKTQNEKK